MKQKKDYTLLALAIPFLIALIASGAFSGCDIKASNLDRHYASDVSNIQPVHQCTDKTHLACDGGCECDGMECKEMPNVCRYEGQECPNYNTCTGHGVAARDYQIDLHFDTVRVYDGNRLVDTYISNWKNQIDTILLNDNQ